MKSQPTILLHNITPIELKEMIVANSGKSIPLIPVKTEPPNPGQSEPVIPD